MKFQIKSDRVSQDKTKSFYLIATPAFHANPQATPNPTERELLKNNQTFIEEKARESFGGRFVDLRMSEGRAKLILTVRKSAQRHTPDFNDFKRWLASRDF